MKPATNGTNHNTPITAPAQGAPSAGATAQPGMVAWPVKLLLTFEELAIVTNLGVRTLKRLVQEGKIAGVTRIGRCVRFNRVAVERWVEQGCPKPTRHGLQR